MTNYGYGRQDESTDFAAALEEKDLAEAKHGERAGGVMENWTKGPWVSKGRYIGTPNHMSAIGECRDQNGNWSDTERSTGNANLIAAAPELYAALKSVLASVNTGAYFDISTIRKALAKARGETEGA